MRKFIQSLLIIVALLIGGLLAFAFLVGTSVYDALYKTANEAVVQQVTDVDGRLCIRVPLQEEYGMVINGFRKCSPPAGLRDEPDYAASCTDGRCTIVVTLDEEIPDSIGLYVEKGDACLYEQFSTAERSRVINYFAKVEMSDAIESALALAVDDYDVGSLKAARHIAYRIMGSKKVILHYGDNRVASDLLTVNGEVRASIVFE